MDTLFNETLHDGSNNASNSTLPNDDNSVLCFPSYILNATSVQSVYISDIAITVINIPFAIFAFLVNLAIIATVIRISALHRPVNVLLCSLAAADCLTGLVAQPVYVSWRFVLHHTERPCKLVHLYQASKSLPFLLVGCTFLNLAITGIERLYAVSRPIAYSVNITLRGMVKTVVTSWVVWVIYISVLETSAPKEVYAPMENITLTLLIAIPIAGHILTFHAIRTNNRKILSATHTSQLAIIFKREKKAFRDMALYTVATLLSILPILLLLNVENTVIVGNILFPWVSTFAYLVSSFNPVIQIFRNAALRQALKATFVFNTLQ